MHAMKLIGSLTVLTAWLSALPATGAGPAAAPVDRIRPAVNDALTPAAPGAVRFTGWLGQQIETCRKGRMMGQSVDDLVAPFRERTEERYWQSEFWGKWFTSAALAWRAQPDDALRARLDEAVRGLIGTQTPDGYIGNYKPEAQTKQWDIWGRKYVILGLLAWYDLTGDAKVLEAAVREADFTMTQVGPDKASIVTCGNWTGMAASSILEPMVLLHRRTGEKRFLDFAEYVVRDWTSPKGPDLLRKALAGTSVYDMFPGPNPSQKGYMSGGQSKAYEMMSCYEGLVELHRVTGRAEYAEAAKRVAEDIFATEITIIGSGSSWERWCRGRTRQTEDVPEWMETCVAATWIKFNAQLLRLTGEAKYADRIEQAAWNALTAAQKTDGTWWSHYNPLEGGRGAAPEQCKMHANCCVASGPRALMLLPPLAVMTGAEGPVVNFYAPAEVNAGRATLKIEGDYPRGGEVAIAVQPSAPGEFSINLRIPAWSKSTSVRVNGRQEPAPAAGTWLKLRRAWAAGDRIEVGFDMTTRLERDPGKSGRVAIVRGPLVMAMDRRITPPQTGLGPATVVADADGRVDAKPVADPLSIPTQIALDVPLRTADGKVATLRMCDFASAGTTWDTNATFRVWLPQPLDPAAPFEKLATGVVH